MLEFSQVSKIYELYDKPSHRLLDALRLSRRPRHRDFYALRDVSFHVNRGEVFALIGPNGSGKSTALQIAAGILRPTRGRVVAQGRVAALLELGAGFNPEFTGRENVYLNAEIMGLSRRRIDQQFPHIAAFADIGDYIHRPVKEYSSGMYVRLAFATAIHVEPDILIVDEALAVGDAIFANRCLQKFEELRARNVTILFVSHDLALVKRLAHRALFLLHGQVQCEGFPSDIVNRYVGYVLERQQDAASAAPRRPPHLAASFRHGDGASEIISVELLDETLQPTRLVHSGDPVTVRVRARFHRPVPHPVVGILLRNRLGIDLYGTNSRIEGVPLPAALPGQILEVDFRFPCLLARNECTLTVATQHPDGFSQDWLDDVLSFEVLESKGVAGAANLQASLHARLLPLDNSP